MTVMKATSPNTDAIPEYVISVVKNLQNADFEAYFVGGCVRDLILGREPKDWDITTDALPEEIIKLFDKTFYENSFGTVGVVSKMQDGTERVVEVTPYRLESEYSDNRHPNQVHFSKDIKDDLLRRDFTINAIALDPIKGQIIDLYKGQDDIDGGIVRAVGDPNHRFEEDGLRILRAVRLATELGFIINQETEMAMLSHIKILDRIAKERIRDEFIKMIMSDSPMVGIALSFRLGILKFVIPELEEGVNMKQNQAHSYSVFEHLIRSLQHAADKKWSLELRLAALLHDIGKPATNRFSPEKGDVTFYGHEVVGAKMAKKALEKLRFPRKVVEDVVKLIRWHMFFSDTEQISLSAVRRMVVNVGPEHIWDLMNLRICDRVGTGRPKENPYRFRKYKSMVEEALRDPISVAMLKVNGKSIMKKLHMEPGPRIGFLLNSLLDEVLDDPTLNTEERLNERLQDINKLSDKELKEKSDAGKKAKAKAEEGEIETIRQKYHIK